MGLLVYINLARDVHRAQAMDTAFAACRHQPTRFEAVDWRALPASSHATYTSPQRNQAQYFRGLTAGECGCYASHVEVWRALLASDEPWALVLEDDVEPAEGFDAVMDSVDGLGAGWDMVKLVGREREQPAWSCLLVGAHTLVQYRRVPSLTGAYLVSREGARKLLNTRVPFARPIDIDIRWWWENQLALFGVAPYPVALAPTSADSSIGQRGADRSWAARWRKLRFNVRYNLSMWRANRGLLAQRAAFLSQRPLR